MLIIIAITAALAMALSAWARWLHRKPAAPRSARALAFLPMPLWLITSLAAGYGMVRAFDAVQTAEASVKASQLASAIAWSMYVAAAGLALQLALGVVLAVLTRRTRRRLAVLRNRGQIDLDLDQETLQRLRDPDRSRDSES